MQDYRSLDCIANSAPDISTPNAPKPGPLDSSGANSPWSISCQDQELDDGDRPSPRDMGAFADSTACRLRVVSLSYSQVLCSLNLSQLTILVQLPQELSQRGSAARDDLAATVQAVEDLQRRVQKMAEFGGRKGGEVGRIRRDALEGKNTQNCERGVESCSRSFS